MRTNVQSRQGWLKARRGACPHGEEQDVAVWSGAWPVAEAALPACAPWPVLDVSSLVLEAYAAYRPLISDALAFFLAHVAPARMAGALAEQKALPPATSTAARLALLVCHFPTLHKLGQVVARDRRLSAELRRRLQVLESLEPTTPLAAIRRIVRRELGAVEASMELGPEALAEGSVAVVVPFHLSGSGAGEGVLKVLKPGVEERLLEELEMWPALGSFLDARCEGYGLPALNYAETLETVRDLLCNEVQLDREQQHLVAAAKLYAHSPGVRIPAVLPFSSRRVTAMEYLQGVKVTEADHLPHGQRRRLAANIVEALVAKPLWELGSSVQFHADPHAGNLLATDDEQLAIVDWSLVGHLNESECAQVAQVMLGAFTFDGARIAHAIASLARAPLHEPALRAVVEAGLGRLHGLTFPGIRWLIGLFDDAKLSAGAQFDSNMTLFRKSLLTLEGVLADVCPDASLDRLFARSAARQLAREWLRRGFAFPTSRRFGTHLCNLDLMRMWCGLPAAGARCWRHCWKPQSSSSL